MIYYDTAGRTTKQFFYPYGSPRDAAHGGFFLALRMIRNQNSDDTRHHTVQTSFTVWSGGYRIDIISLRSLVVSVQVNILLFLYVVYVHPLWSCALCHSQSVLIVDMSEYENM
jgi:hypothetical protein